MRRSAITIMTALTTVASAAAAGPRSYLITEPMELTDTAVTLPSSPSARHTAAIEARALIAPGRRLSSGAGPNALTIAMGDVSLTVGYFSAVADNIDDDSRMLLTLAVEGGDSLTVASRSLAATADVTTFLLEWTSPDTLTLSAGRENLEPLAAIPAPAPSADEDVRVEARGSVTIHSLVAESLPISREERLRGLSPEEISRRLADSHPSSPAGYYRYLDRSTDPAIATLGGRYRLAVVPTADASVYGPFLILYIAGAEVEPTFWRPGMLKGELHPTAFRGQYNLEWHDAHGHPVEHGAEAYATFDPSTAVITLTFPALNASFRLARE